MPQLKATIKIDDADAGDLFISLIEMTVEEDHRLAAMFRIKLGMQDRLYLGNLDAKRDWGHAKDYVEAMWLMLQQSSPTDFVIASGEQHSVRDFVNLVAKELDMPLRWEGTGPGEKAFAANGSCVVAVDSRYYRPSEVDTLLGDPSKARRELGYSSRPYHDGLADAITWFRQAGYLR